MPLTRRAGVTSPRDWRLRRFIATAPPNYDKERQAVQDVVASGYAKEMEA